MIYFLGDVHGRFDHILPALAEQGERPASVVFLGDIEPERSFETEIRPLTEAGIGVWFIHGNHDTDDARRWQNLQGSQARNLDGRVVEIEGLRVAGLGGVFRGQIWYPDRPAWSDGAPCYRNHAQFLAAQAAKTPPRLHASLPQSANALKHRSTIFPDVYDALKRQRADILVVHEAPSCHPHGFRSIDALAREMGVQAVFHGHHHDCLDYRAWQAELGFRAHGVGLRGILDLRGEVVRPGELDALRAGRMG